MSCMHPILKTVINTQGWKWLLPSKDGPYSGPMRYKLIHINSSIISLTINFQIDTNTKIQRKLLQWSSNAPVDWIPMTKLLTLTCKHLWGKISQTVCRINWPSFEDLLVFLLEKAMAPHSSTLAWKIPWMEEPGGLQSMGSLRVGHNWATSLSLSTFMHWRRKWQPTPVFFPGESQGRGSLVGCRLWGRTESDTTEAT